MRVRVPVTERALWCRDLAQAMVDTDLSVDAAARLWGLDRSKVMQLLRSDTVRRPTQVMDWLGRQISGQQEAVDNFPGPQRKLPSD